MKERLKEKFPDLQIYLCLSGLVIICIVALIYAYFCAGEVYEDTQYLKENGVLIEEKAIIIDKYYRDSYINEEYKFVLRKDDGDVFSKKVSLDTYYNYEIGDEYVYSSHYELEE